MKILSIETSCDETAAAVIEDGTKMLSNVISSSVDLHKAYGGVVPEIAARSHLETIIFVIEQALKEAFVSVNSNQKLGTSKKDPRKANSKLLIPNSSDLWSHIDAVAVTYGPGLGGSLLIGVLTARTLAIEWRKPLYAINHVQAHIYANFITSTSLPNYTLPSEPPTLPLIALIVSGGHTQLVYVENHQKYMVLGKTRDDAVGEAFDKVAKVLGLPYPGGPAVAAAAVKGDPYSVELPKAKMTNKYDFSFSGLKTAVLRAAQAQAGQDYTFPSSALPEALNDVQKANIAASFQRVAIETLIDSLKTAIEEYQPASVVIGGGVAANAELRSQVDAYISTPVSYTDIKLCTDNAAMIGATAYFLADALTPVDPYKLEISPSLAM